MAARRLRLETLDSRRVLASAYQNPGQVFDVNNDTFVDREDVRLSEVRLATIGEGALPSSRNHPEIPFYDVNGDGSFTRQDLNDLRRQVQNGPAQISFKLAKDSGNPIDRVTNDVRIVGRVMGFENGSRVFAWFGEGRWSRVDITQLVRRDGSFELSIHDLHRINGRLFADGQQTLLMQSYNRQGRTSGVVDYSFTIDRTAPVAFHFEAQVVEPPVGGAFSTWVVRWTPIDAKSYELRVTTDAVGNNSAFARRDIAASEASRLALPELAAGTYYVFLTGFDESGNKREAIGSGQQVEWAPTHNPPVNNPPINNPPSVESIRAVVNPAVFEQKPDNGGITDTWSLTWVDRVSMQFESYKVLISRDRAGADVAFQTTVPKWRHDYPPRQSTHAYQVSVTHLPAGTYYVFVTDHRTSGNIVLLDGAEVTWRPNRPGDFRIATRSGFVTGNNLAINWQAAERAVRYEVNLRKIPSYTKPPDVNSLGSAYDQYEGIKHTYPFHSSYQATTTSIDISNVPDGEYLIDVVAIDAQGHRRVARNFPALVVDGDGVVAPETHVLQSETWIIGSGSEKKLHLYASNFYPVTASVRFELFTSADLTSASRVGNFVSSTTNIDVSLENYLAYERLYLRITYYDGVGRAFTNVTTDFQPSKLERSYRFPRPIGSLDSVAAVEI